MADRKITGKPGPIRDQTRPEGSGGTPLNRQDAGGRKGDDLLLTKMVRNMADGYRYWKPIYDEALEDLRFIYDTQWDEEDLKKRELEERPALTLNYLPNHINLVTGGIRKNRFDIKVIRRSGLNEDNISSTGGKKYSNAEVMAGIVRDIQRRSKFSDQSIAGAQHSAESGFGFWKIKECYPPDDPRHTELRVMRLQNRFSVMFDPHSTEIDYSDANWVSISFTVPRRVYEERYGRSETDPGQRPSLDDMPAGFDRWWTRTDRDEVRIVEYWWKEPCERTLVQLAHRPTTQLIDVWLDEIEPVLDELIEIYGWEEVPKSRKKVKTHRVLGMHATAKRILEKPVQWKGIHLPVVMIRGRSVDYDGKTRYYGLCHYAKDAQVMTNYWASAATERVALSPKDGWLLTAEQIEGHEEEFETGGGPPKAYKTYNWIEEQHPPIREQAPSMPAGEISLLSIGRDTVKDTIGIHEANLGEPSNEVSGRAIAERQMAGATSTYEYADNLASSIRFLGEQLVDLIPKVYTGPRIQRIIMGDMESTAEVVLNQQVEDRSTGKKHLVAALNLARYEVDVKPGPSFASQREEMVSMLTELGKNNPEAIQPVLHLLVLGMDIPFAGEISHIWKSLVPRHLLTEEDQQKFPPPEPTPQQQLETLQAQASMAEANARVEKANADVKIAEARLEERNTIITERELQVEEQRLINEAAEIKVQQTIADTKKLEAQAKIEGSEEEVERRAKRKAADSVDPKKLP